MDYRKTPPSPDPPPPPLAYRVPESMTIGIALLIGAVIVVIAILKG